ncbi:MAG TPA: IPTL-CTERM sorting domain-containing protein [Thermoanaerobaculia bacterium]|nr:IPTL-CTERM sorting domain-containing protein [Thermoanaerobaculia bacterium]
MTVTVTSGTAGTHTNTIAAGTVTSSNAGTNAAPASDTLTVNSAPTVAKSFTPSAIALGGTSTLTVTLTNGNSVPVTGVAFTDTYPGAIVNAATPNAATTCSGSVTANAGAGSLALTGGVIPASGSCTVTVSVTSNTAGSHANTIPAGGVTTANAGQNTAPATASLTVTNLAAPSVAKSFTPSAVAPGQTSTLTITLTNSNASPITGVSFTDSYPAAITNGAVPNGTSTCGGTVTATAGGASLALSGGTIPALGSCTVSAAVVLTGAGPATNTLPAGAVTSANAPPSAAAAAATLTAAPSAAVPALSPIGLILLGLCVGLAALVVLRR